MSEVEVAYHKRWLDMLEPIEGLVVSVPVLVEAECMEKREAELSRQLANDAEALTRHVGKTAAGHPRREIVSLDDFLSRVLGLTPDLFARGDALPADLELYVPEGGETLRPGLALKKRSSATEASSPGEGVPDVSTPQSRAGEDFVMLVSDLPGVPLDAVDRREGHWAYPPLAKFDRLLRACRVPIGLLTNREELRLVYAPHGESSGVLTFRVGDLGAVGGRDILDAFVMLLSKQRFFGVQKERQLPALLRKSRAYQANVTTKLADQVFEALVLLLRGFERAAERDGPALLEMPLARGGDHVYGGLLTVLLRLVFLLYAEDRDLLPTKDAPYANDLSLLSLFSQLQADHAAFPDTMARRFGAWPRLLAVFRAVYFGARWAEVAMPPRRGELFDPTRYPFLEGWGPEGGAPRSAKERALLRVPTIDDETLYRVFDKLLVLDGQRLSYRALDVEQIGSVYEKLIGYSVVRLDAPAVCLKPERVWVSAEQCRATPTARRAAWLQETAGVPKKRATQLAAELAKAKTDEAVLDVLDAERVKGGERRDRGDYVLLPGTERRRSSSHYTPKSLTSPIVARTLEPLLRALGDAPTADQLLALKICDPAMGSGAFLVETCRFLADQVVAAWSREGKLEALRAKTDDVVLHARRLVAQRCLYGVDLNPFAVTLARLSMWLVTLAKDAPFTFVDHALRHGDSLVGLTLEQLRAFHWTPPKQLELTSIAKEVDAALEEARGYRERILALAEAGAEATEEKEHLLRDAELALERTRIVGDLVIGAFFAHPKDKDRERARAERLEQVRAWFDGDGELPEELRASREQARGLVTPFHWSIEFPEIFHTGRLDPTVGTEATEASNIAWMDAFVGNPPFMKGGSISGRFGDGYRDWLPALHPNAHGNSDLCAHFFRRAWTLLGSNGVIGFVASKTIAEGDTRSTGLLPIATQGGTIFSAIRTVSWSDLTSAGQASVSVSIVHIAKGTLSLMCGKHRDLNGEAVQEINSQLRARTESQQAEPLQANRHKCFKGWMVSGEGFLISPAERIRLIDAAPHSARRIFEYIGGEEVNSSPTHDCHRHVIRFGKLTEDECREQYPELLSLIEARVRPQRLASSANGQALDLQKRWWQWKSDNPNLERALIGLPACIVNSQVSKHLVFARQSTTRIFGNTLYVFPFDGYARFAVLQSRIHEPWARLLSSSMRNDLRYASSDCFETFPFPRDTDLASTSPVELTGKALYEARAKYMVDTQQGLTQTYNKLKDPEHNDARIVELRRLHEAMDRAVLDAYGWHDIPVPSYGTPVTADDHRALEQFGDEVIDRLFALNQERAEEERRLGSAKTGRRAAAARAENDNEPVSAPTTAAPAAPPKSAPRQTRPGLKKTSVPPPPAPKRKSGGGSRKR